MIQSKPSVVTFGEWNEQVIYFFSHLRGTTEHIEEIFKRSLVYGHKARTLSQHKLQASCNSLNIPTLHPQPTATFRKFSHKCEVQKKGGRVIRLSANRTLGAFM